MPGPDPMDLFDPVRAHLLGLQDSICAALTEVGAGAFAEQSFAGAGEQLHRPRVLAGGEVIEKAAVHFSSTEGGALPPAATTRRPELTGQAYRAASVSVIVHPVNPMAPTAHANFRFFFTAGQAWWFGGGFDLTPCYGFEEDCRQWHAAAARACAPFGTTVHAQFKEQCDRYFYLPHRAEARGIGGVFYDDLDQPDFPACFDLHRSLAAAFAAAYVPILARRAQMPYTEEQKQWQLVRRGRYVEFNLLQDRGTRFGLEANGRVESILASLPPLARWDYEHRPGPGSPEAQLLEEFLVPRDWLADS